VLGLLVHLQHTAPENEPSPLLFFKGKLGGYTAH
jgi:hypothetical protein